VFCLLPATRCALSNTESASNTKQRERVLNFKLFPIVIFKKNGKQITTTQKRKNKSLGMNDTDSDDM
jgi:hypothetical protein